MTQLRRIARSISNKMGFSGGKIGSHHFLLVWPQINPTITKKSTLANIAHENTYGKPQW